MIPLFWQYVIGIAVVILFLIGIRIVRPTQRGLVERLGKYRRYANPGFHWLIPIVDQMVKVNVTEQMVNAEPQEIITNEPEYRALSKSLKEKCAQQKAGSGSAGPYMSQAQSVKLLLGSYFIHWELSVNAIGEDDVCCTAKYKVDDPYDFHTGKQASFSKKLKEAVTYKGQSMTATVNLRITVPDRVLVAIGKALKAQDFQRVTNWQEEIVVPKAGK